MNLLAASNGTRTRLGTAVELAVLALAPMLAAGQAGALSGLLSQSAASVAVAAPASGEVVRILDDPHTGDQWLLMRGNRGGPGRLVLAGGIARATRQSQPPLRPVIRTGDRLIVEENTTVAEAHLEAVALGPAASGSPLQVRLMIGGRVVRAVALGPGRAAFAPEAEALP